MIVKAKKHLGQHFLKDENICRKIAKEFRGHQQCETILEIGPGMGALTKFLLELPNVDLHLMELDLESIGYLQNAYPELINKSYHKDFLKEDLQVYFGQKAFAVVGNFPYNISSQILFKCLVFRNQIPEIMGMFQKEVAVRIAEKPGSKNYGILSVLMQAFYDISYCFTVDEHVFDPPPKVKSGVISCVRNSRKKLNCDEQLFFKLVKTAFNQRRKTLRNALKPLIDTRDLSNPLLDSRAEQLSVEQFIALTKDVENIIKQH